MSYAPAAGPTPQFGQPCHYIVNLKPHHWLPQIQQRFRSRDRAIDEFYRWFIANQYNPRSMIPLRRGVYDDELQLPFATYMAHEVAWVDLCWCEEHEENRELRMRLEEVLQDVPDTPPPPPPPALESHGSARLSAPTAGRWWRSGEENRLEWEMELRLRPPPSPRLLPLDAPRQRRHNPMALSNILNRGDRGVQYGRSLFFGNEVVIYPVDYDFSQDE